MTRTTKPDPDDTDNVPAEPPVTTHTPATPAAPAPASSEAPADLYEPFPGAHFFHGGRNSPIVQVMARRLAQEGHWPSTQAAGPDWTRTHRRAFAAFQQTLRPKGGGPITGVPDEVAWDRLQVPRVTPIPKEK